MPLLNFYLLRLKSGTSPRDFLSQLQKTSTSTKIIVSSKPQHLVVATTSPQTSSLNQPWDLMLLLQSSDSKLPSSLQSLIVSEYSLPVGIPSKLLSKYPQKNRQLIEEAKTAGLTGSLDNARVPSSSQNLELSPELLEFMDELMKSHSGPVTMLNLLKFKKDGKQSYYQYGQHFIEVAKKRGGDAKIVGNVVEEKGHWHEIAIVHYASIKHFCDMLAGKDYQAINEKYRLPALEDTLLLATTEFAVMDDEMSKSKL